MRRTAVILLATALAGSSVAGQESARERARLTLSPEVFQDLSSLAVEMTAAGVPDEPLFAKALEGAAKRVPADLLMPAVRAYAGRLGDARSALGPEASVPLLVAGADALQRGVSRDALRAFPGDRPRSPMAIVVLADLLESGVPVDRALDVLREAMAQRTRDDRMLDISARVRRLIREGVAPQDAVDRVRRALARDRAGNFGAPVPPGSEPVTSDRLRDRSGTGNR